MGAVIEESLQKVHDMHFYFIFSVGHMKECLRNCLDVDVTRMKLHFAKRSRVPDSTCLRELHLPKENAITLSVCPLESEGKDGDESGRQSPNSQSSTR